VGPLASTGDGLNGDSVLYANRDFDQGTGLDVHIRTTVRDFYSYTEAAAVLVGITVVEMSIGNTGTFYVDGVLKTDADLPIKNEGKYVLDKVATHGDNKGSSYMLTMGTLSLEFRIMKFIMGVNMFGAGPGMEGSAGQMGSYPVRKELRTVVLVPLSLKPMVSC